MLFPGVICLGGLLCVCVCNGICLTGLCCIPFLFYLLLKIVFQYHFLFKKQTLFLCFCLSGLCCFIHSHVCLARLFSITHNGVCLSALYCYLACYVCLDFISWCLFGLFVCVMVFV